MDLGHCNQAPAEDGLRPLGFPGCRLCPLRHARRPDVCLACFEQSAGQRSAPTERCACCGQGRVGSGPCPTRWCRRRDRGWSVVFCVGEYAGGLRRAILRYKFGRERWWAGVFGLLVAGYLDHNAGWFDDFDLLVATPSFTGPGGRRAWDPVEEILAEVAGLVEPAWSTAPSAVVKRRETSRMSGQDLRRRQRAAARELRFALEVPDPAVVAGARVLVLDDVLAEGSTLREVARALRSAGAREVAGLVLARAPWQSAPGQPL